MKVKPLEKNNKPRGRPKIIGYDAARREPDEGIEGIGRGRGIGIGMNVSRMLHTRP